MDENFTKQAKIRDNMIAIRATLMAIPDYDHPTLHKVKAILQDAIAEEAENLYNATIEGAIDAKE